MSDLTTSSYPPPAQGPAYPRLLAATYDTLAHLYSLGAITACRRWGAAQLLTGSRVLFAGAGTAVEAVEPAHRGVHCDLIDSSEAMLDRARRHFATQPPLRGSVNYHLADIEMLESASYDVAVAHFFLNTFDPSRALTLFRRLLGLVRPGGRLIVGEFALPAGPCQQRYHDLPMRLFARWTGSSIHPTHDITHMAAVCEARQLAVRTFPLTRWGPAWYESRVFAP